ncbi:freyrasin family ranthipeptide [Streptomyces sp. NPDC003710]
MSESNRAESTPSKKRLLKAANFRDEIERRGAKEVRDELGLPNIDAILKDLQERHGVRIGLSPKLIERMEAIKARATDDLIARVGCQISDLCIFCDQGDYCVTCDVGDWCLTVDTH